MESLQCGPKRNACPEAKHEAPFLTHSLLPLNKQPKAIKDIRVFLETVRRKDARFVKIWRAKPGAKGGPVTKFKIRCSRYIYTLRVEESEKADRLKASLPPGLKKIDISK